MAVLFTKLADESAYGSRKCFRKDGYRTGAIVNVDFLTQPFGLTRGFTDVDFEGYPTNAKKARRLARTTDAARDMDTKARPINRSS